MSRAPRVLVVEDEQDIATLVKHTLERSGEAQVQTAASGDVAIRVALEEPPDLIILDLNLPVLSGSEVCRILRGRTETARVPIIMLTARTSEADRVAGLDMGADDYVTKPFSLRELSARVRAVLRRQAPAAAPAVYQGKHLRADFDAVSIAVDGEPVRLTRREFELLRFLVDNRNRVLSRDRLLERVWGYERFIETRRELSLTFYLFVTRQRLPATRFQFRNASIDRIEGALYPVPVRIANAADHRVIFLNEKFPSADRQVSKDEAPAVTCVAEFCVEHHDCLRILYSRGPSRRCKQHVN